MEIERETEEPTIEVQEILDHYAEEDSAWEDQDGDVWIVTDEGVMANLASHVSWSNPSVALESHRFRRVRAKIVILGLAALALLAGCTRAQDNGFMAATIPDEGPVILEEGPDEIVWPSTPLRVRLEGYGSAELDRAIDRWENRRPFSSQDLFRRVGAGRAEVYVGTGLAPDPDALDALGDVRFFVSGSDGLWAVVHTYNTPSSALLECVLFHELGHVLGLSHDDFGPMQPNGCQPCLPGDPCEEEGPSVVDNRVTDGDHRRLLERY